MEVPKRMLNSAIMVAVERKFLVAVLCCLLLSALLYFNPNLWLSCAENLHAPSSQIPAVDVLDLKGSLPVTVFQYLKLQPNCNSCQVFCDNIYINVRTSHQTEESRLPVIFSTWMQTVYPDQIHLSSDFKSSGKWLNMVAKQGVNTHSTKCGIGHNAHTLCCKSMIMWKNYYDAVQAGKNYKWFCHFDDDIYVNTRRLVEVLSMYNPRHKLYFGRWPHNINPAVYVRNAKAAKILQIPVNTSYRFATGGAYCISNALMMELKPHLREKSTFSQVCTAGMPDDMALGAISELVLGFTLTDLKGFNTHLNNQKFTIEELKKQVTVGYLMHPMMKNVIYLPEGKFTDDKDPTRFFSYHCLLYPDTSWCHDL